MKCDCPLAGRCETHGLNLTPEQHRQCRDVPGMYDSFARLGSKRTRPAKPRGFGDTVEGVAKRLRLDRAAKIWSKVTGKPCGCGKRRELLNRLFPFK